MIIDVLWSILDQLVFFVANIFLLGFVISLLCRLFYRIIGGGVSGRVVCYATGIIGTPIHELSHALMCIIFGHKIVDINVYNIDIDSGVLGFVSHEYNPRNPYHVLGNYFIGIAPILMNTAVIYLLFYLLLPDTFALANASITSLAAEGHGVISSELYLGAAEAFSDILYALVSFSEDSWRFWVFVVLILSIALHMNLSGSDITSALGSLPLLLGLVLALNFALAFIAPTAYSSFVSYAYIGGIYTLIALIFGVALSVVCLILGAAVRLLSIIFRGWNT